MRQPARTVFLGSGEFAVPSGQELLEHPDIELVAVVTAPPRPAGRRAKLSATPIGRWAAEHALPTITPRRLREPEAIAALAALRPDLLVLADYGQLVPAALLELPARGALNVHPSLLPRHRGAAPIQAAILEGDDVTGVTLMVMDAGLDSGPIVAQRRLAMRGDELGPELERTLADLGAVLLGETLPGWLGGEIEAQPQAEEGATLTRPLRREDGRLDPARPAVQLERQVRALQPWPGSFLDLAPGRLTVWRAAVAAGRRGDTDAPTPGDLVVVGAGLPGLVTSDGVLVLPEVQPAGGRRMSGADWLRGRRGTPAPARSAVRR